MKWSARFFLSRTLAYGADGAEGNAAVRAMEIAVMHGGHQLPAAILLHACFAALGCRKIRQGGHRLPVSIALHVLPRWPAARSEGRDAMAPHRVTDVRSTKCRALMHVDSARFPAHSIIDMICAF